MQWSMDGWMLAVYPIIPPTFSGHGFPWEFHGILGGQLQFMEATGQVDNSNQYHYFAITQRKLITVSGAQEMSCWGLHFALLHSMQKFLHEQSPIGAVDV